MRHGSSYLLRQYKYTTILAWLLCFPLLASPRQQYKATVGNQDDDDEDSGESSNGESADHPLIIHPTEPHGPGK